MTLRKMYLVPAEHYDSSRHRRQPPPPPPVKPLTGVKTKRVAKRGKTGNRHPHVKWVAKRTNQLEADMTESELIHRIADLLRKVMPQPTPQNTPHRHPQPNRVPKPKRWIYQRRRSGRRRHPWVTRASVTRCRNVGLAEEGRFRNVQFR